EKRFPMDDAGLLAREMPPIITSVEGPDGCSTEHPARQLHRHRDAGFRMREALRSNFRVGPVAGHQNAPAHVAAAGEAVDPADRIRPFLCRDFQGIDVGIDVIDSATLLPNPW